MQEPKMKLVLSREQIQARVKELAQQISNDYAGLEPTLVGVLNGVFMFYADLVRNMSIPVQVDFVRLASYGGRTESSGQIVMTKEVDSDVTGRHILVIEDIVDSGLTLEWLHKYLGKLGAASVKTCVLIDKTERREIPVDFDYTGFHIDSGFLIGYGLDYDGRYRQLPEVFHLETV